MCYIMKQPCLLYGRFGLSKSGHMVWHRNHSLYKDEGDARSSHRPHPHKSNSHRSGLCASSVTHRLSWLSHDPRHTTSTHLPLIKFLPTMQNNWFCSKNPRKKDFINYPHFAVKSILNRRNMRLLSFSPYPISYFASSSIIVESQFAEAES